MSTIEYNEQLIATCGMNCTLCLAYQRDKNNCCGCNINKANKRKSCLKCSIKNCPELVTSDVKFCFVCKKFPCRRLKQLDKRYQLKYGMSMIANNQAIAKFGIDKFIDSEQKKWLCRECGNLLCVHRNACLHCGAKNLYLPLLKH
jgi:hypothetical protein